MNAKYKIATLMLMLIISVPAYAQATSQKSESSDHIEYIQATKYEPDAGSEIEEITRSLSKQLAFCLNVVKAQERMGDETVFINIIVNKDRTISSAQIVDQARYTSDTHFRAAADTALRALKHPICTPLNLPPDKYKLWKTINLTFDTKLMQ